MKKLLTLVFMFLSAPCFAVTKTAVTMYDGNLQTHTTGFHVSSGTVRSFYSSTATITNALISTVTITNVIGTIPNAGIDSSSITKLGNGSMVFPSTVTIPNQPYFSATKTSTSSNVTGDGTFAYVAFDTEVSDTGNRFTDSSTFTATISGRYHLSASISFYDDASANRVECGIETSNRVWGTATSGGGHGCVISTIADMEAGDTAKVFLRVYGGALVVDITPTTYDSSYRSTWFTGALIH